MNGNKHYQEKEQTIETIPSIIVYLQKSAENKVFSSFYSI
jgi:hypothetical protein